MTPEETVLNKCREAQKEATTSILSKGSNLINIIEVVANTSWFAQEVRNKHIHPDSPKIACKEKCHWCCHQSVSVSEPEIFQIANLINSSRTLPEKNEHISRLSNLNKSTQGKSRIERAKIDMPCAFLRYGKCSIYEARPLLCQKQTSYDEKDCRKAKPKGFPYGSITSEKAQMIAYDGAILGMHDGLKNAFGENIHTNLDLTSATLKAIEDENLFNRWASGEHVFNDCVLVESAHV
jgi:Fe-S-cluster containining protein